MNGIVKWGFLSILGITLYSCSSENLYDPEKASELKFAQYEAAFIEKYGEINPNQNWGFGEVKTRAFNVGNWRECLPDDITTEERIYVKSWFTSNHNPETKSVNWSDFFIQNIYDAPSINSSDMYDLVCGENDTKICTRDGGVNIDKIPAFGSNGCSTSRFGFWDIYKGKYVYTYTIQNVNNSYYVGIDYDNDGYYNDWILKITPMEYKNAQRVMAEDLSSTNGDFDFNDIVFDAVKVDGSVVITLRAAGGTMPLYIEDKEVHELFGVSQTTMVNTQEGKKDAVPCVIFRLNGDYTDIKDIPITVNGVILPAEEGKAPGKLCCPASCNWTNERESIESVYKNFQSNITNGTNWWQ